MSRFNGSPDVGRAVVCHCMYHMGVQQDNTFLRVQSLLVLTRGETLTNESMLTDARKPTPTRHLSDTLLLTQSLTRCHPITQATNSPHRGFVNACARLPAAARAQHAPRRHRGGLDSPSHLY